jgi:hypothetical protein
VNFTPRRPARTTVRAIPDHLPVIRTNVINATQFSVSALRLGLTLVLPLAFTAALHADGWAPNLTTTAIWHSNATNAENSDDQLDSLRLKADILASERYSLSRDDSVRLSAHFAGDWWPRYDALLGGAAGGRAELRHQFGNDPLALEVAVEGSADWVEAREGGRRGTATAARASARKRINTLTRVTAWHEASWFNARLGTYDYTASETALELDRDLTRVLRVTLTGRFRDGDIVTYASGVRPDLEDRSPHHVETNTFDRLMTAYRLDAQTWSGQVSLVRAMDDSTAILAAYEYRHSKRGPFKFPDHALSVAMVHQF